MVSEPSAARPATMAIGVARAARRAIESTVDHLRATMGDEAWQQGMNPEIPETKVLDNPYTYTDYRSTATHNR